MITSEEFEKVNKLWRLIEIALDDLEKAERSDFYSVNMNVWHAELYPNKEICEVCLSGAIMAFTLNISKKRNFMGEDILELPTYRQLFAVNSIRMGKVLDAIFDLEIFSPYSDEIEEKIKEMERKNLISVKITPYEQSPTLFKKDMMDLMKKLKKLDL